jgi:hypothetical protein
VSNTRTRIVRALAARAPIPQTPANYEELVSLVYFSRHDYPPELRERATLVLNEWAKPSPPATGYRGGRG